MSIIIGHSVKRLFREGTKSLSVPLIALVLVFLINLLGGIRFWLETQYEDTMDNYPIVAVISDLTGENIHDLDISMRYIDLFIDPDVHFSLVEHTGSMAMRRALEDAYIPGYEKDIRLVAITNTSADTTLNPYYGAEITFFDGYDEEFLISDGLYGLISYDLYPLVDNGLINIAISVQMPDELLPNEGVRMETRPGGLNWYYKQHPASRVVIEGITHNMPGWREYFDLAYYDPEYYDISEWGVIIPGELITLDEEMTIIGTIANTEHGLIYGSFWVLSRLVEELFYIPTYTESLSVTISDNRRLDEFKETAAMSFSRTNPVSDSRPFAMTIHDLEFYETLEPLRQNIIVVDVATPFIYILSIAVGFLTSVLLTRRRKAEFAVMRSIGVNRMVIFISALAEQAILSISGAVLGFVFVALIWNYTSMTRPTVFLACYLTGAIFAAIGAAGTNVMKVLRDKRE